MTTYSDYKAPGNGNQNDWPDPIDRSGFPGGDGLFGSGIKGAWNHKALPPSQATTNPVTGPATWDIAVDTDGGRLLLSNGGSTLRINERSEPAAPNAEYPRLYEHFAKLVRSRQVEVDIAPMRLVADALLCGRRIEVEAFVDG